MRRAFGGLVKWVGTHPGGTKACIAPITERRGTQPNSAGCLKFIWSSLSK